MRPGEWHDWDPEFKDFRNFLHLVWDRLLRRAPTRRQYELAHYLQHGPTHQVVQTLRGLGKSWIVGTLVPWELGWCPWLQFLVSSASQAKSDEFSTFVQQLLELDELAHIRPDPARVARSSRVSFDVEGAQEAAQVASVQSRGVMGQITGGRAHRIIADDVETPNTADTVGMRAKLRRRALVEFAAILLPPADEPDRPAWIPQNGVTYLGTPHIQDTIYAELARRGYSVFVMPAEYPDATYRARLGDTLAPSIAAELDADPSLVGHATDERFPDAVLERVRAEMGRSGYRLQMQLDTSDADALRHPLRMSDLVVMELDRELGPSRVVWAGGPDQTIQDLPTPGLPGDKLNRPLQVVGEMLPFEDCVVFVDPSGSGSDETAAAAVKRLNGQLWLAGMFASVDGSGPDTMEGVAQLAKRCNASTVLVEQNFGGEMFVQLLTPYLKRLHPCRLETVRSARQKELRIADTLEPLMNQHRLGVDAGVIRWDAATRPTEASEQSACTYGLLWQMARLTRERGCLEHDDRLEALASACAFFAPALGMSTQESSEEASARRARELAREQLERLSGRRRGSPLGWSRHRPAHVMDPSTTTPLNRSAAGGRRRR